MFYFCCSINYIITIKFVTGEQYWYCWHKAFKIVLFTAPGGTLSDDVTCTEVCLFKAQEDMETMQAYAQVNTIVFMPRSPQKIKRIILELVQKRKCVVSFRSFTSLSGVTNTWRRGLRRRSKRLVFLLLENAMNSQQFYFSVLFYAVYMHCVTWFSLPGRVHVSIVWQLLLFLKGFTESERNKLAMLTGILLANGSLSASILSSLFNENVVKEGTLFYDS